MKVMIFTRRRLAVLTSCLAAGLLVAVLAAQGLSVVTAASRKLLPIYSVETAEKKACLTFDAAWGNEDTQELIEVLGKYKAKATFFIVGEWVDKYPESVKALHDAGHSIQNHSNTHKHYPKLSRDEIIKDLNACNDKIEKITGVRPTLVRPPYGDYDNAVIEAVNAAQMTAVQWDVDSLDWKDLKADEMYQKVVPKVRNGSIILFHNAAKHTPEALPAIIEALQKDGYSLVTVEELLYKGDYTLNHAGRQIPKPGVPESTNNNAA